jgi:hypothetical protein
MPQWAGSCWYYLRYCDPKTPAASSPTKPRRIGPLPINNHQSTIQSGAAPVDLYVGGTEHAVLHLLYARFWHKVLFDLGHVTTPEPFQKLVNQGLILGEDGQKMSKSRGNVVNPDDVVRIRRRRAAPLRNVHGPARTGETLADEGRRGRFPLPRPRLARRLRGTTGRLVIRFPRRSRTSPAPTRNCSASCTRPSKRSARTSRNSASTPPSRR